MRVVAVIAVAAALLSACSQDAEPDLEASVIEVEVASCTANVFDRATAAVIDTGLALTVAHTFSDAEGITVAIDGQEVAADLVYLDAVRDLALLAFEPDLSGLTQLDIVDDNGDPSDRGRVIVFEDGVPVIEPVELLRRTEVTLDGEGRRDGIEIGGTIEQGDSGAPVVDSDGRLIGLVFATSRVTETGWAVAGSELVDIDALAGAPISLSCP